RMVIFSLLLMVVVLFYRRGLMGDKELTWSFIADLFRRIKAKFTRNKDLKGGSANE
ncbi:MAG: branched-chain amino acid ABC transporter permease, partial [Eubacterium sp.]